MTHSLSGYFLSRLVMELASANAGKLSREQLATNLAALLQHPDAFVDLGNGASGKDSLDLEQFPRERLGTMNDAARAALNALLPWSSFNMVRSLPLGGAYAANKRASAHRIPDKSINEVAHLLSEESTILEVGCFEGHYTTTLAMRGRRVYAFDARIENVIKTLVRTWALGMESKVTVDLLDLEKQDVADFYRGRGVEKFDLVYHRGVLYHLSDPVLHLANIASLTDALYLSTQYASDDQANNTISTSFGSFRVFDYHEADAAVPFAGMVPHAIWLRKDELFALLRNLGFSSIDVTFDIVERNGNRIALTARKQ